MLEQVNSLNIKLELINKLYNNFVENGLDQTSMRDLCKGTGVSLGSLYYWFDNKEDLVIETALFGFENIIEQFFKNDFDSFCDIKQVLYFACEKLYELKKPLRFIYQVALSPVYSKRMIEESSEIVLRLDNFVKGIIEKHSISYEKFIPIVMCFLSAIVRDVVWNEKKVLETQLEFLSSCIDRL